ncbi:hypothetical protein GCM10010919_28840 [Alishewanella longhuensis]|uniref:Uncharacterized protein n=1 Tax=Alishewanella longhuensis TaxID=1091037 RepID=A0ABQ3L317_9ALTE|nr:hypothetical protein [Alishewanella longhuensis]GHG74964.1 hypothetical protein GCM10010919_28840 [Alishewanella longhuensis]
MSQRVLQRFMLRHATKIVTGLVAGISLSVTAQQTPLQPGEPLQYKVARLAAHEGNTMTLDDGSVWQTNMQHFGLTGNLILLSGRNLRSGSNELLLNGFTLSATYKQGTLNAQQGFKLTLLAALADGKRLTLSDNLTAFVLDSDRRFSRNWQANNKVILSEDRRSLLYLPNLQQISVQITQTAIP